MRSRGAAAAATVFATYLGLLGVADAGAVILGAAPEDQAKYAGPTFKCLDGSGSPMPMEAVNDEFCDCPDGSDEPGTGACAGQESTHFYCENQGSTPRRLYASRVGDGICDCCDGSDEAVLAARRPSARCKNDCAEKGMREAEENKARLEKLQQGVAKRDEVAKAVESQRQTWRAEIEQLKAEHPALKASYRGKKAVADAEREAAKAAAAAAAAAAGNTSDVCMFRQTGGCTPSGPREASNDRSCHEMIDAGISGYCDCNGNGQLDENEQGYDCDAAGRKCRDVCHDLSEEEAARKELEDDDDEKPQVSEYAKWMDGADDALGDKKAEEKDAGPQKAATSEAEDGAAGDEGAPAKPSAADEEEAAKRLMDDNEEKTRELERKFEVLPDDHLGYASLMGQTLSKKYTDFTYKVSFFDQAKQDHTSLGTWSKWTGPKSAVFEHGTMCWGGPERQLQVNFHCGVDAELLDVSEPSRCVYEANIVHPGACDASEVAVLASGTRVIGPRDEL